MRIFAYLRSIKKSLTQHQPLITVQIARENLLHNIQTYRQHYPRVQFTPVLKSNAYGHGLVEVARILDTMGVPYLTVDSLYEAWVLRDAGIRSPLLIIGFVPPDTLLNTRIHNTTITLTSLEQLTILAKKIQRPLTIHLKIDTGMHRQGILIHEIPEAITKVRNTPHLRLTGVCSHCADADGEDDTYTRAQLTTWEQAVSQFKKAFPTMRDCHIASTAGAPHIHDTSSTMVRLGLGLYGIPPSVRDILPLRPVLSMHTSITSTRTIPAGDAIGYNCTYTAPQDMRGASLPVGYFEGMDRRLSNCGHVQVAGIPCPIVGRVSMNISSIDISLIPDAMIGTPVTIISHHREDPNSIENIARTCGTIPYEILVHIPQHLRRVVV